MFTRLHNTICVLIFMIVVPMRSFMCFYNKLIDRIWDFFLMTFLIDANLCFRSIGAFGMLIFAISL